ncbi:hypothetical protein AAF712_010634 [Marasmius tenuissimus]|uniref:Uncharacterized protein n=1 Tax=Marasmius tenuissimus TaxID=585030 RepID=A0ABR2ZLP5_9AGAR
MSPQDILSNVKSVPRHQPGTSDAMKRVQYLERRPEHKGEPIAGSPLITFAVNGVPGPYVSSLMAGNLPLDGFGDLVFENPRGGLRANIAIDHPQYPGLPLIRINTRVGPVQRPMVSISFYGKYWVPLLAIDAD